MSNGDNEQQQQQQGAGQPAQANGDVDWQFGMLNDVSLPYIGRRAPSKRGDMMTQLGELLDESYKQNSFAATGPYKGIVLRDETQNFPAASTAQTGEDGENIPIEDAMDALDAQVTCLRVRIPEIHAALPIPKTTGAATTPEDNHIIDLYDIFRARQTDGAMYPVVMVGEIVWVDYGNKQNFTDPIYLGPLVSGNAPGGAGGKPPNSGNQWDCTGKYKRTGAPGDKLAGSNVSLKPYQGLPRLKRLPKDQSKFKVKMKAEDKDKMWTENTVLHEGKVYNKDAYEGLKKAWLAKGKHEVKVFFGHIPYNGMNDSRHKPTKRSTMIIAPWYFSADEPWELIYWFHGLEGFSQKNFENRMMPQINKMIKEKRNFVLVKPELPWSIGGTGKFKGALKEDPQKGVVRQTAAWLERDKNLAVQPKEKHPIMTYGGAFAPFHFHVLDCVSRHIYSLNIKKDEKATKVNVSKLLDGMPWNLNWEGIGTISTSRMPTMTSIYGHSNGGSAIARAAVEGALKIVQPDRIFFSDSDYNWQYPGGGAVGATWKHYVKSSKKKVWLTMLTIPNQTPRKQAETFFAKTTTAEQRKKHYVYHIAIKKSHAWCGHNALSVTSTEHLEAVKKEKEAAAKPPTPTPKTDPEKEENKVEQAGVDAGKEKGQGTQKPDDKPKEPPKAGAAGTNPPPQKPAAPASVKPKESNTKDPPKPNFKLAPAVPYKENRVKIKDYGNPIKDKNSKLLIDVGDGHKAHVLVAKRWEAMKKAAIADGLTDIKVASGWRQHRWKSKENYLEYLKKKVAAGKYKSISEGKKYIAYASPHETGLALDIVGHGLDTNSGGSGDAAKAAQKKKHKASKLGAWLIANAHKYGFTPYGGEVWHWEVRIPVEAYTSGKEYTDKFDVRTATLGKPGSQNVGKTTTGVKPPEQPCVRTVGGGRGGGGAGAGSAPGVVSIGKDVEVKGLGKRLFRGPTKRVHWVKNPVTGKHEKNKTIPNPNPERFQKECHGFCIHEQAGWSYNRAARARKQRKKNPGCGVHFWHMQDGSVCQTAHPALFRSHASNGSAYSTCTEMAIWGPANTKEKRKAIVEGGEHVVGPDGDISMWAGAKRALNYKNLHLPTPTNCKGLWLTIAGLAKHGAPPPTLKAKFSSTTKVNIPWPLKFPCIKKSHGKVFLSYWNGSPMPRGSYSSAWWLKNVSKMRGIFCHGNVQCHPDGFAGLLYVYARSNGLSHANAYYYLVGCAVSAEYLPVPAEGGNSGRAYACDFPFGAAGKKMISRGKKKYPFPLTAKTYIDYKGGHGLCAAHVNRPAAKRKEYKPGIDWWNDYKKKNPSHIGDLNNPK